MAVSIVHFCTKSILIPPKTMYAWLQCYVYDAYLDIIAEQILPRVEVSELESIVNGVITSGTNS